MLILGHVPMNAEVRTRKDARKMVVTRVMAAAVLSTEAECGVRDDGVDQTRRMQAQRDGTIVHSFGSGMLKRSKHWSASAISSP